MSRPRRIQMSRRTAWRVHHPHAVRVDRATRWGNPYSVAEYGSRAAAVETYRRALLAGELPGVAGWPPVAIETVRRELAGRDLACRCPPDQPCYAEVLIDVATSPVGTADPAALAAQLQQAIADLDGNIERRAGELAAPIVARDRHHARAELDTIRVELQRRDDLVAELRRQLDVQLRQVARLRWVARYLPPALRGLVLPEPAIPGAWAGDRPDAEFVALVDETAGGAGLVAYPDRPMRAASGQPTAATSGRHSGR